MFGIRWPIFTKVINMEKLISLRNNKKLRETQIDKIYNSGFESISIYPYTDIESCLKIIAKHSLHIKSIIYNNRKLIKSKRYERMFYKYTINKIYNKMGINKNISNKPGQTMIYTINLFNDQMANDIIEKYGKSEQSFEKQDLPKVLYIKSRTGKVIEMDFQSDIKICGVMQFIEEKEQLPMRMQRLCWAGQDLAADRTLRSYLIGPGTTIELVLRLR